MMDTNAKPNSEGNIGNNKINMQTQALELHLGKEVIEIQQRYEFLSVVNDFVIAIWFLIGGFMFLNDKLVTDGTWLFVLGSAQMLIRPIISLAKLVHIRRIHNG